MYQPLKKINYVIETHKVSSTTLPIATTNPKKIEELKALGLNVLPVSLHLKEIQGTPEEVLIQKAKDAYEKNGGIPTIVEDTSLEFDYLNGLPGSYTKDFLSDRTMREKFCAMLPKNERGVMQRVGLAIYDGEEVQMRLGQTRGSIAFKPQGPAEFAFDDIFIPEADTRTYAEMILEEKNKTSARAKAYKALKKTPFKIGGNIYQLPEPPQEQLAFIRKEEITKEKKTVEFAYGLEILQHTKPNKEFTVDNIPPFHKVAYDNGAVVAYTVNPDSASQGLVLLPRVDLQIKRDSSGNVRSARLDVGLDGEPVLLKMGPKAIEMALAARATEFGEMHSEAMHQYVRDLASKKIKPVQRSNTRSPILEEFLGMRVKQNSKTKKFVIESTATIAIATKELGYKRESFDGMLSRKKAAMQGTFLLGPDGVVSNLFALGGMPPVTGSRDVLVTAALSYMRCWIPRNGVFAGHFERQLKLFTQARKQIESLGLPKDIEKMCIAQIGISVGCEDPKKIAQQVKGFQKAGGHAVRIYTTNPDIRIVETAKEIYKSVGKDFLICVGPITDVEQARKLRKSANVRMFLIGHGGGENCTSLTAGGAANSIEILYEMYLDPLFNDSLIGMEGGTGTTIGALLPMLDVISLNRRGVSGIENTGGLYVQQSKNGVIRPVLPYHGSASVVTQLIESHMSPEIAKRRLDAGGKVRAVEGKPNYMVKESEIFSCVDRFRENRAYAGLALADQQSQSIYELRKKVAKKGHNHVGISPASSVIANEHRAGI